MPKSKYYKKFTKKKKRELSIFATDHREFVTYINSRKKKKRTHLILKTFLVLEFLQTTSWELGEKIQKRNKNIEVINNYLMGLRIEHGIYNIHELLINLRILLRNLTTRMLYKKKCLINFAQNEHIKKTLMVKPIENFPKRELMVTWNKWLGGVLTNFKTIAKRILVKLRSKYKGSQKQKYCVSYGKNLPKIPHFVISTGDCHWAINESNLIRIKSLQLVNTDHLGPLTDMTMAMNTSYYALRSFTALIQECASSMRQTAKIFYKRKLLRRISRKTKTLYYTNKVMNLGRERRTQNLTYIRPTPENNNVHNTQPLNKIIPPTISPKVNVNMSPKTDFGINSKTHVSIQPKANVAIQVGTHLPIQAGTHLPIPSGFPLGLNETSHRNTRDTQFTGKNSYRRTYYDKFKPYTPIKHHSSYMPRKHHDPFKPNKPQDPFKLKKPFRYSKHQNPFTPIKPHGPYTPNKP